MKVEIRNAEEFDGQAKIELRLGDATKVFLYLCTTERKIKGMYKEIMDSDFTNIPEQNMKESEEEWRY